MGLATLDRVLAALVLAIAGTGLLALKAGRPDAAWVFAAHGLLGGALLAATVVKARRSVPPATRARRWRPLAIAVGIAGAIAAALVGGFAWVASGRLLTIGQWTVLTLHAWAGLVVIPLVVVHLLPRRWRVLRPPARSGVSRRSVLVAAGYATVGVAAFASAAALDRALGGVRRFTGSRWLASGSVPPPTTFYGEAPPSIDADAWRLTVADRRYTLAELKAHGEVDMTAVLDCTSGWALETTWRGVPLAAVLPTEARGSVRVRSVTGWSTILTADETATALLATGVAGGSLPRQNGAPCRLVIPNRRGLDWVKWIDEVGLV